MEATPHVGGLATLLVRELRKLETMLVMNITKQGTDWESLLTTTSDTELLGQKPWLGKIEIWVFLKASKF